MGYMQKIKTIKNPEEIWEVMSRNIRALCELNGISLNTLAEELGVGAGYFTRPRSDMPVSKAVALGEMFGVSAEKLWDETYTAEIRKQSIDEQIERLKAAREALENE